MVIIEYEPDQTNVLDFVHDRIRDLRESGQEARFILAGSSAYRVLCEAISKNRNRAPAPFETYEYLTIVLDPFRDTAIAVVPAPNALLDRVHTVRA